MISSFVSLILSQLKSLCKDDSWPCSFTSGEFFVLGLLSIAVSFSNLSHLSAQIPMLKAMALMLKILFSEINMVYVCMHSCVYTYLYTYAHINQYYKASVLSALLSILSSIYLKFPSLKKSDTYPCHPFEHFVEIQQ